MPRRYNLTETPYQSPDQLARACSDVLEAVLRKSYDEDNPIEPVHVKRSEEKQGDARHSVINKTLRDLDRETFKKFSSNNCKKYKEKQNRNNGNTSKFAKNNSNIITKLSNSSSMLVNCSKATLSIKPYHHRFGVFGHHKNKKQQHFYISMWYEINTQFKRIPDINDFPIIINNSNIDSLKLSFVGIQMSKIDKPISQECQPDIETHSELEDCKTVIEELIAHVEDKENNSDHHLSLVDVLQNSSKSELKMFSGNEPQINVDIDNIDDTNCEFKEILQLFSLSDNEEENEIYYDISEDENQDDMIYHDAMEDPESEDNEDESNNAQKLPLDDYEEAINYLHQQIHHVPRHNEVNHPNSSRRNRLERLPISLQAIINYLNGQGDNQQLEDFEQYLFRQNGQAIPENITVRVEFSSYTKLIAFFLAINAACLFKLVIGENAFSSFF